ncbi:MAG: UbiX family flavin prenyltransferase [Candidatus Lokiarchaeota archaeon]|nr:UbiX family flavin prenyltransferase [Candidatus Lokiarchaeota archaeon]MBD3201824.1 UbiX family flavin prenyltransferase [Candidatus Lokiarchaeota archaeon]
MKTVVAITGATGIPLAVRLLTLLKKKEINVSLIISKIAEEVIKSESSYTINEIKALAENNYDVEKFMAPLASGSNKFDNMVIIPCSMKTLAAISNGYANNLITRTADVAIKEKRKLVLVVRESPFSSIHLENMLKLAKIGVTIAPPIPSYYPKPKNVEDIVKHTVGRILDQIGLDIDIKRWGCE